MNSEAKKKVSNHLGFEILSQFWMKYENMKEEILGNSFCQVFREEEAIKRLNSCLLLSQTSKNLAHITLLPIVSKGNIFTQI